MLLRLSDSRLTAVSVDCATQGFRIIDAGDQPASIISFEKQLPL